MMDVYLSEGVAYLIMHFEEKFIPHKNLSFVYAVHSILEWNEVVDLIKKTWGYGEFFNKIKLLKETSMKNGKTNFVFEIS